jgi:hypothetical protein
MQLKPIQKLKHTRLREPLQTRLIQILQSKLRMTPLKPFEIIKDSPPKRSRHINPIHVLRRQDIIQETLIVIRSSEIPEDGGEGILVSFEGFREPEFRDHDVRN